MERTKAGKEKDKTAPLLVSRFAVYPKYVIAIGINSLWGEEFGNVPVVEASRENFSRDVKLKLYFPSETRSIFSHLLKVNDENTLLWFVHKYGLLGVRSRTKYKIDSIPGPCTISPLAEDISSIYEARQEVKRFLDHWQQLKAGKPIEYVRDWIRVSDTEFEYQPIRLTKDWIGKRLASPEYVEMVKKADDIALTKLYLALWASKNIGGVRPIANLTPAGDVVSGFTYLSLHDAIWHQIYQLISENDTLKECPHCHHLHNGRRRFCPPPPGYKRSPCENAYNQKQKRIRDKEKEVPANGTETR